jgi:hypothetical protein
MSYTYVSGRLAAMDERFWTGEIADQVSRLKILHEIAQGCEIHLADGGLPVHLLLHKPIRGGDSVA